MPEFRELAQDIGRIRGNSNSVFVKLTEVLIIGLMTFCTIFNTFYVPNKLREYQVPIIFRGAETNVWFDRQRIHNALFVFTVILGGCLPNLSFMSFGEKCLHTGAPDDFSIFTSDRYQYLVAVLLWVILVPLGCMGLSSIIKDQSRLFCLPILIANLIFGFLMVFIALYIILYVIFFAVNPWLRWIYLGNLVAILIGVIINQIYNKFFDKRDLLKEDDGGNETARKSEENM